MTVVTPRNAILLSWQWVSDMVVAPLFTLAMVPGAQRLDNWPQYLVYTTIACGLLWCLFEMVQLLVATCCSSPSSSTLAALAAAAATLGRPATPLAPSHSVTMLPLRILLMLFEVGIEMIAYGIVWLARDQLDAELQVGLTLVLIVLLLCLTAILVWSYHCYTTGAAYCPCCATATPVVRLTSLDLLDFPSVTIVSAMPKLPAKAVSLILRLAGYTKEQVNVVRDAVRHLHGIRTHNKPKDQDDDLVSESDDSDVASAPDDDHKDTRFASHVPYAWTHKKPIPITPSLHQCICQNDN